MLIKAKYSRNCVFNMFSNILFYIIQAKMTQKDKSRKVEHKKIILK